MCLRVGALHAEEGLRSGLSHGAERAFAEPGVRPRYAPDAELVVHHIALHLRLDPSGDRVQGEAQLTLGPREAGFGRVRLHLDEVEGVEVSAPVEGFGWRHADGVLTLTGLRERTTVTVRWTAQPRRGLYFIHPDAARPGRGHQVWSQGQDEDSHFYFPCFDHPAVRHPWTIELTVPAPYTTVSNGELVERVPTGPGWVRWRWEQRDPIPAYLVTVVVSDLSVVEDQAGALPLRYLGPAGCPPEVLRRVFGRTPQMITCFEQAFGTPFPWPRYDQVVVEDFIFGGMENVGATTLTDLVITDDAAAQVVDHEALIAHELAHQWFGDLVTCRDWAQGWLNEGWATYAELVWYERSRSPGFAAWFAWTMACDYLDEAGERYRRPIVSHSFREPIDVFDRHLYEKGALVLRTLRAELGDVAFWAGVRAYLGARRLSGVHTLHLEDALSQVSGRSLEGFFHQWVHQPGHPVLTVRLAHEDGLLTVEVEQTQSGEGVPEVFDLTLRVIVHSASGTQAVDLPVRARARVFAVPCAEAPRFVQVDPDFRVLADLSVEAPGSWLGAALVQDPCPVGRIRAAQALAKAGEPAGLRALAAALRAEPEWFVRGELARIVGGVRGPVAREALLAALGAEAHLRVRRPLVAALGELRGEPGVEDALLAVAAADPSLLAQAEALRSLGRLRAPRALGALEAGLGQESWAHTLRIQALAGLGASQDPAALARLLAYTAPSQHPRVQAAAVTALGQLAEELPEVRRAAVDRITQLAESGGFRLQMAAVAALARANDPRALGVLGRLHRAAPDGRVRRAAYEALATLRAGQDADQALGRLRRTVEDLQAAQTALRARVDRLTPLEGTGDSG